MRKICVLSCCIWLSCFAAEKKETIPFAQEQKGETILSLSKGRKWAIKERKDDIVVVDRHEPFKKKDETIDHKIEKS